MKLFSVLAVLFLASVFASAYSDRAYTLDVQVNPDGGAHVIEKSLLNLDTASEIEAFEFVLREGKTTLADWQKFSRNIRYHTTGSVFGLRIVAAREFATSFTSASVTLEYDVQNLTQFTQVSSRKTRYDVDMQKIVLGNPGEVSLGQNMIFVLRLPKDAVRVAVSPNAGVTFLADEQVLRWVGPTAGTWDVVFEREITLAQEVQLFFVDAYAALASSAVLWLLLAVVLGLIGYKVLRTPR
ncbi:MAG: hypothetical protein Q8P02_00615 [Candidatus Micrarchaeota archaeon]|nr:hypothetical protein [Candidatus Micrarchaeota archaeon]